MQETSERAAVYEMSEWECLEEGTSVQFNSERDILNQSASRKHHTEHNRCPPENWKHFAVP